MQGLSRYAWFVKVCRVFQSMEGFQGMKSLSRLYGFVKIERVCQGMKGLSILEEFVKIRRVCQD